MLGTPPAPESAVLFEAKVSLFPEHPRPWELWRGMEGPCQGDRKDLTVTLSGLLFGPLRLSRNWAQWSLPCRCDLQGHSLHDG